MAKVRTKSPSELFHCSCHLDGNNQRSCLLTIDSIFSFRQHCYSKYKIVISNSSDQWNNIGYCIAEFIFFKTQNQQVDDVKSKSKKLSKIKYQAKNIYPKNLLKYSNKELFLCYVPPLPICDCCIECVSLLEGPGVAVTVRLEVFRSHGRSGLKHLHEHHVTHHPEKTCIGIINQTQGATA